LYSLFTIVCSAFETCFKRVVAFEPFLDNTKQVKYFFLRNVQRAIHPELSLVPSSDEKLVVAAEATSSQVEATIVNPFEGLGEDNDDIDTEEDNTMIRPTKPSHVDFRKSRLKEDTLRYSLGLIILTMLNGFN
jgi:hypothetical protein